MQLWLQSPLHPDLLLQRPRDAALDCGGMTLAGRSAAMGTTWRGPTSPP